MNKMVLSSLVRLSDYMDNQGESGGLRFVTAPARINIIGEHIDYVEYFKTAVLPFVSDRHVMVAGFRPRSDEKVTAISLNEGFPAAEFPMSEFQAPGLTDARESWHAYLSKLGVPPHNWVNYIKGSCFYLMNMMRDKPLRGFDIAVDSGIPPAGGASSSSALVVVAGVAARMSNGISVDMGEVADASAIAEWYVGTRGGKMDHAAICLARECHALLVTFQPFSVEHIPMPSSRYRWVTFYSHEADKGSAVMSEYNERSIVSKYIIPSLLESVLESDEVARGKWNLIRDAIDSRDEARLDGNKHLLDEIPMLLPETIRLRDFLKSYEGDAEDLKGMYPALFETKGLDGQLEVRSRCAHHLGEIHRVISAANRLRTAYLAELEGDLETEFDAMRKLGNLMNMTHASLRDLYGVSTPDLEFLADLVRSSDGVLGARVMGGGFGGNLLALVLDDRVDGLISSVRRRYYYADADKNRREHIMISRPGTGSQIIDQREADRFRLMGMANKPAQWSTVEGHALATARKIKTADPPRPVKPIIVAAGKGTRARDTGLIVPKPLAPIFGVPVVRFVLEKISSLDLDISQPIVVVNPEAREEIDSALSGLDVSIVEQKTALGTADAVFCCRDSLADFDGDVIVIWGTQPVVRRGTIAKTVLMHQAMKHSAMTLPTTLRKNPYAPLRRNKDGWIIDSYETHSEKMPKPDYGEDNIGVFVLKSLEMTEMLDRLHRELYQTESGRYNTPSGELGFPNMMIRHLARDGKIIIGIAMADPREAQGIKIKNDIELVEKFISEIGE